jgi:hypothetical protein
MIEILVIEKVIRQEIEVDVISTTPTLIVSDLLLAIGAKPAQSHSGCSVYHGDFGKYNHIVIQTVGEFQEDDGNEAFSAVAHEFPSSLLVRLRTDEK